jgi:hypothetical protein
MSVEHIRLIEEKYEVESIKAKGQSVWPLIRFYIFVNHQSQVVPITPKNLEVLKIKKLITQFFYGFGAYFRRYDYICFSDSAERKLINGKWVDKTVDFILESIPNTLLIELPLPSHYPKSEVQTRFIASKLPLYVLSWICAFLFLRKIKIENENILKEILVELNIRFDYRSVLKKQVAQYKVGSLVSWIYKPKGAIIQSSYTNSGYVKAFKNAGITVVEVQHGLITESHEAYNVFKRLDASYFPDYFLSYGLRERDLFARRNYLTSEERVIPIGHYYLDHVAESVKGISEVIPEVSDFSFGISITGQNLPVIEERFIDFMAEVAKRSPEICFFYIPRSDRSAIFRANELPKNMVITLGRDTYEVIRLTRFHTTIFSTCAIEALVLGTPNILVNINNLARLHFDEILENLPATVFVESVEEYIRAIRNHVSIPKEKVINSSSYLITSGYKKNVEKFIEWFLSESHK